MSSPDESSNSTNSKKNVKNADGSKRKTLAAADTANKEPKVTGHWSQEEEVACASFLAEYLSTERKYGELSRLIRSSLLPNLPGRNYNQTRVHFDHVYLRKDSHRNLQKENRPVAGWTQEEEKVCAAFVAKFFNPSKERKHGEFAKRIREEIIAPGLMPGRSYSQIRQHIDQFYFRNKHDNMRQVVKKQQLTEDPVEESDEGTDNSNNEVLYKEVKNEWAQQRTGESSDDLLDLSDDETEDEMELVNQTQEQAQNAPYKFARPGLPARPDVTTGSNEELKWAALVLMDVRKESVLALATDSDPTPDDLSDVDSMDIDEGTSGCLP